MRRPFSFLLVAATAAILYARTTQFDFVRADDADLIAGNQPFLSDLRNIPAAFRRSYFEVAGDTSGGKTYYRPVAIVSFMLDARRGGASPQPYHATNVVLHAAAASLLLPLARAWGASPPAAFLAAMLFAVHPVNVQAVAWVAGRNDLLVAVFAVLSMLVFPAGPPARSRRPAAPGPAGVLKAALHALCVALALFSKETALLLPPLALLQERLLGRRVTRAGWVAFACDGAVVAAWAALRSHALAGSTSELSLASLQAMLLNAPHLLVHAGKVIAPLRQNVSPGIDAAGLVTGAAAVVLLAWAARRGDRGRPLRLGACWALAFLLPPLAVQGMPAYEHRVYVALAGLLAGAAAALGSSVRLESQLTQAAIALLLAVFAVAAHRRQDVFRDPFAYWSDGTRDSRFGPVAHVNLGQLHEAVGRPHEARREYLRALERDPNTPKAHNNLGVVLMELGERDLALSHFNAEARRHRWNADAWFNLGLWHEGQRRRGEALEYYERALSANPSHAEARLRLEALRPSTGAAVREP